MPTPDAFPDLGDIRFRKIRDAGSVLNATFAFLRRNAREVFVSFLAVAGPLYIVAMIMQTIYLDRLIGAFGPTGDTFPDMGDIAGPFLMVLLLAIASGIVSQAAAGAYVRLYRRGEAGTIEPSVLWDETRTLIGPVGVLNLAFGLGAAAVVLLNIIPCLGQIATLVFFVWVIPIWFVMTAVVVVEERSVGDAWTRARALVKGEWGFAFGAILLAGIVFVVIAGAASIPGTVLMELTSMNSVSAMPSAPPLWILIVTAPFQLISIAAYLVPMVAGYFVHGRLAEEMDGSSLVDDLDVLAGGALGPAAHAPRGTPTSTPPPPVRPPSTPGTPDAPDAPETDGDDTTGSTGGFRGGGFRA